MNASDLFSSTSRVVPVVAIGQADHAIPLAECLLEAGIDVLEVTLRTDVAIDAIRDIAQSVPAITVGAGSIRATQQLQAAHDAGATFAVSPGYTDALTQTADDLKLPYIPGAATPSEMMVLYQRGYHLQKFFPAELSGGVAMLKALSGPLPEIRFMPTGGITPTSAADYLSLSNVTAIGGTWIAPSALLDAGDFDRIAALAREAVARIV